MFVSSLFIKLIDKLKMPSSESSTRTRRRHRTLGILFSINGAIVIICGVLIGIGGFTFGYAEGHSYFSNDPTACANCHVMQGHFDSWQKSSHHHVAVCNDCHLPSDGVRKYITKADNGFFHSLAFTLDNFHEPIQIKERNRRVTQESCIDCHSQTVHAMLPSTTGGEVQLCIKCHASVGHGLR